MANRYAIAGLGCVALAMVGALLLVGQVVFGGFVAGVVGVLAGGGAAWCWYVQPLLRRRLLHDRVEASSAAAAPPGARERGAQRFLQT